MKSRSWAEVKARKAAREARREQRRKLDAVSVAPPPAPNPTRHWPEPTEADRARWRREYEAEKERRALQVRTPPLPASMKRHVPRGQCRWCEGAINKPDGTPNTRRNWHTGQNGEPDCLGEYYTVSRSSSTGVRASVLKHCNSRCCDCGKQLVVLERVGEVVPAGEEAHWGYFAAPGGKRQWRSIKTEGPYQRIAHRELRWQVDHEVPLWSVDKNEPNAIRFWKLENLRARCDECHKVKSRHEAAARAKGKRQSLKFGVDADRTGGRPSGRRLPTLPF